MHLTQEELDLKVKILELILSLDRNYFTVEDLIEDANTLLTYVYSKRK